MLGKGGRKGGMQKSVVQVGIVSWEGGNNCLTALPNVAARVSNLFGWISSEVFRRTGEVVNSSGTASKSSKRMLRN